MSASYEFDVLIIGTGVAGLATAAKLADSGLKIALVTREKDPNVTNTYWAQGGIIFAKNDEQLSNDIMKASSYTSLDKTVRMFSEKEAQAIQELLLDKAHADFEKDEKGDLKFTMEAAHSRARIVFKGDYTGKEIQVSLLNFLKNQNRFPNVSILTGHTAIDLLTPVHHGKKIEQRYEENKVIGAYVFNQDRGKVVKVMAKKVVLATGGIGALYLHHSNAEGARGDGHAMAHRAGATLINMEFIQFHPTTFYDKTSHRRFLMSEAIRGEGGVLINSKGEAFMHRYHPDRELAPRDVVARSIDEEMLETKHESVYLDISHKSEDWIKERFPTIYSHCLEKGIDITKQPIPVVPAAHYTCGGVKTDLFGRTELKNLYAVGEVACNGLHGANRLASTSLAEGLTWGMIAAEDILQSISKTEIYNANEIHDWVESSEPADLALIHQDWLTLKQTMWNYVGLTRTSNRLKRAQAMFRELYDEIQRFYRHARLHDELIGLRNAVEVAYQVLQASQRNKNSIGCFYRKD